MYLDTESVPFTDKPPVFDDGAPFPDPAGTCHPGDPSTDPDADAGTFRPADAQVGASGSESAGWADVPAHPADMPLISPSLTVAQLETRDIPARITTPGHVAITLGGGLVALRLPAGRPDWCVDAVEATKTANMLNRIEWVERVDGSLYRMMRMSRPELLAAHAIVRNGQTVGELLTDGDMPLGEVARGTRGAVTEVSEAEALGVGAMLDWASETATAPRPQAVDTRTLARDTALVRDAYNRAHPEVTIRDKDVVYRAFDLLGEDADEIANRLTEAGEVSTRPMDPRAAEIVEVVINAPVAEVASRIADALANAVQAADATLPLVLSEPGAQGSPARLLSVTPSGEVLRWDTIPELQTLALLAVQPVTRNRDGDTRTATAIPTSLLGLVALRLRAAAAPVEHITFEPSLLGDQVVASPGYHPSARAVLVMPHRERRRWASNYHVPARPTAEEAQSAYELLDTELCGDFPWAAPRDRARMMAALLTGAARTAVTVTPGFSWDANEKGTGKSYAAETVRMLGQGSKAAATWTLGRGADDESMKKLAGALIARNTRFWHNDEVRGPVDSPVVGKIITSGDGAETIRELGGNRLVTVRGIIVTACGNNIRFADDHARRWLRMRMEKPLGQMATGGKYRHLDLEAYIRQNRPALVAAAHTLVLRAIQQGPAFPIPALGFGASWSRRILGALSWVKTSDDVTVATLVLKDWETDVSGYDHNADEWGAALEYTWARLPKPVPAGEFAKVTLTSDAELPLPDELVSATLRSRAKRWSHALKGLRGQKIHVGDRVYRVLAHDAGGRWLFSVEAYDNTTLREGREEPLTPPPLTDLERTKLKARIESVVY